MIAAAAPPDEESDNRFTLKEEISKVFKDAVRRTFTHDFPDNLSDQQPCIIPLKDKKVGDYVCKSPMTIWPKVRESGRFNGCRALGQAIVSNLQASDMMECKIVAPGVIPIKLSSRWIATRIQKMLIYGIDIWAPKYPIKKVIVDFSSRNIAEEMTVGHLRSTIIGDAFARMLEYSKVDVVRRSHVGDQAIQCGRLIELLFERFPNGKVNDHTIGELEVLYKESKKRFNEDVEFNKRAQQAVVSLQDGDERYRNAYDQICEISREGYEKVYQLLEVDVEEKGKSFYDIYFYETLVFLAAKGLIDKIGQDLVIFIEGTSTEEEKIPLTVVKKKEGSIYVSTDLTAWWYQLKVERAEWIVYVSDKPQREYTELCITAAKYAEWLAPGPRKYPRGSHVGYGLVQGDDLERFQIRSTPVVDLLAKAKTRCKADLAKRAKANEWSAEELDRTAEAIGYSAVKYADLKNHRLEKYSLNFDQMFNDTGNTVVRLLHVHAQICSIIRKSGKDMNELKKTGELKLEKDEERELGLYLLEFTGTLKETCELVLPHILCEYLFNLSEKFTSFCSISSVCQVEKAQQVSKNKKLVSSFSQKEGQRTYEGSYICKLCRLLMNSRKELEDHLRRECLSVKNRKMEKLSRCMQTNTAGASSASASSEVEGRTGHPTTASVMRKCSYAEVAEETSTSRLLLCEATAVVMRKCFHLLGITPVYNI